MSKDKNMSTFLKDFFPEELTTGKVIQAKRKNFGITLEEVSEVTGIDMGNLSAIENDKKAIGVKSAIKIGYAIGLHPSTILFPNGEETKVTGELAKVKKKAQVLLDKKKFKVA
jgi:transcriptional regulator with XRE-family HTH domain